MNLKSIPKVKFALTALSFAVLSATAVSMPVKAQTELTESREFNIPSGSLDQVLTQFGLEAGLELYLDGALSQNQTSAGLKGSYTPIDGLQSLLAGTGLIALEQENGAYRIGTSSELLKEIPDNVMYLDKVTVKGSGVVISRDEQGYNEVFDKNISTTYMGKVEVERYKGATPSDLLQGMPGIFSGEARNSGALDLNIRGIQGPGRVPVAIDGSEQSIVVWRGYNGATNRSYIDPNLVSNVQIYKGAGSVRDVNTGVGGAMVVNTLSVDDIVKPGENFGVEVKIEGSSNAVKERVPALHTGEDFRDVEGYPDNNGIEDVTLVVQPDGDSGGINVFSGDDYTYRLAVANKTDLVDILASYAYRKRGNYYAGTHNTGYYDTPGEASEKDYITSMASFWKPGYEVLNTSNEMESWLFKSTFHLSDNQQLELGFRQSDSTYGEIMPSRIDRLQRGTVQWPLSKIDAKAYHIKYIAKPEGNRWIDLHINLWHTDTESNTYTRGGFPNYVDYNMNTQQGNPIIENNAISHSDNVRSGINLSNKFNVTHSLDLTINASYQHEQLRSDDERLTYASAMFPREGRRQQKEFDFDFAWRPTEFLELNAGMRYSSFWAFDDYVSAHEGEISTQYTHYYELNYQTRRYFNDEQDKLDYIYSTPQVEEWQALVDSGEMPQFIFDIFVGGIISGTGEYVDEEHVILWEPDTDGNYDRADNETVELLSSRLYK
ncbi:TonB-dependent receptor plug domain-containing protein [Catenovulum sp. 2E275]|uniref:TonB-dependent receptor n=1 Tax=Catenovulum sp. 2E275 TaxID=2980497 RepID=UPI0021D3C177|nr:TonB-dependent receptor [Catenovulum sp. 2E275]MCU4675288.1 TonB-dependent receptor plug domain-containing protein [Catenovulum sp. 2E275]